MRVILVRLMLALGLLGAISTAWAAESEQAKLTTSLHKLLPDLKVTGVKESPIKGLYRVMLGTDLVYMTADGRYVLRGDLLDLKTRRNLSEEHRAAARVEALKHLGASKMISYVPRNTQHNIYVFTDPDCAYCRKLHQEVGMLNASGIAVHYLAFPRAGIGSESYRKSVAIWCSANPPEALDRAKGGASIDKRSCKNPVKEEFELGQEMGVKGTPTIVLENGTMVNGYVPGPELVQMARAGGADR